MKKKVLFAAVALVALASCTNDERIGGEVISPDNPQAEQGAIVFSTVSKGITRADHVGADAANLLNKHFTVGGFKGNGDITATGTSKVFDNYIVNWTSNTAATTESNTSDWEYVGISAAKPSGIYVDGENVKQSIKYWDYSAAQYDFIAYSTGKATAVTSEPTTGQVQVRAIDPANAKTAAYTLKGAAVDLAQCYIADMVTVYKETQTPPQPKFQEEVKLKFRSLASKVRIALYETVPGYSVKDVKFYNDANTTLATGASSATATLFTTGNADKDKFYTSGTYTVKFPTIGKDNLTNSAYNQANVTFVADAEGKDTKKEFGTLKLRGREYKEAEGDYYIGRTSATASFAGTNPYYTITMPNAEGTVLELRVDYTLLSIDGSGEEIKVHGATAYVPAIYAAWKPNYAYTYIFKISDNTNGWTSTVGTDPAGLYPITFDAVVADSEEGSQSTITTVATPSITTYQKGHDTTKDEYDVSNGDIYVQVITDGTLNNKLASNGQLYSLSAAKTEAEVMDALNIQTASDANSITGRNGLVLTKFTSDATITAIPGVDGNNITVTAGTAAKFTPTAGQTYAYVYDATPTPDPTATYYYSAEALTSEPTDWSTSDLWYKDPDGIATVETNFTAGTYYKKYTNQNRVYGVKIIKVVAAP